MWSSQAKEAFKPRKMRLQCAIAITSKSPRHTRGPRTAWQAPTLQPIPHEAGKKPISVVKRYKISTQGRIKLWAPPESTITSELHKLIRWYYPWEERTTNWSTLRTRKTVHRASLWISRSLITRRRPVATTKATNFQKAPQERAAIIWTYNRWAFRVTIMYKIVNESVRANLSLSRLQWSALVPIITIVPISTRIIREVTRPRFVSLWRETWRTSSSNNRLIQGTQLPQIHTLDLRAMATRLPILTASPSLLTIFMTPGTLLEPEFSSTVCVLPMNRTLPILTAGRPCLDSHVLVKRWWRLTHMASCRRPLPILLPKASNTRTALVTAYNSQAMRPPCSRALTTTLFPWWMTSMDSSRIWLEILSMWAMTSARKATFSKSWMLERCTNNNKWREVGTTTLLGQVVQMVQ